MTAEIAPLEPAVPFSHLEPTGGRLGAKAEDFVVDEVLDRQLEGSGEHRLVRIEKIECTTRDAILQIAKAAGIRDRDIGSAGLKDKHAVCTQWLSLPAHRRVSGLVERGLSSTGSAAAAGWGSTPAALRRSINRAFCCARM